LHLQSFIMDVCPFFIVSYLQAFSSASPFYVVIISSIVYGKTAHVLDRLILFGFSIANLVITSDCFGSHQLL